MRPWVPYPGGRNASRSFRPRGGAPHGGGMEIRITSRHTDLPKALRERAEESLMKLTKYESRVSAAEVVFEEEKRSKRVEGIVHIDRGDPIVASGESDDFRAALHQMVERLTRQIRRRHQRNRDHQALKLSEALAEE